MKVLVFHIGRERYGLPLAAIVRVLPVAQLKALPGAPDCVRGLLDLAGQPVPVIDLSRLAGLAPDAVCYDTRILLVDYRLDDGSTRLLGLKAEHVSGVAEVPVASLADSGVAAAPFLGQVASSNGGMLQLVEPAALLTPDVRALLFSGEEQE
ncbi:chemotaxis protein CheW [Massilia horti]|uniref:Purine-binding chemotaxis protein CheW n=1 Tax=Massilia horti TaxID=2562153 RepID=A0A4Y9T834_9BURK|nr:chemotaxis protein CheW [Massilia horti]TFW34998.1 purine-binding chemotaxis protein CheW [Massilia horti]